MIETLDRLLSAHGLAHLRERIVAMMRPAVGLQSTPAGRDGLPPLGTRLGGAPALRTEADWPCNSGKKLDFLLQLDLSELRSLAGSEVLPPSGLLQFFYDVETSPWGFSPSDRGCWAVRHEPALAGLRTIDSRPSFTACELVARAQHTLPPVESPEVVQLGLDAGEAEAYATLLDELESLETAVEAAHQLLGHASPIQGDMQEECQLVHHGFDLGDGSAYQDPRAAPLLAGASDWRLLLQLDSDAHAHMMWGDLGRIYFWMTDDMLARSAFDEAWMILQCG